MLFIKLYYVPRLAEAVGTPQFADLERTANVLVIVWEFLYILGTTILFSTMCYLSFIWRRMSTKDYSLDILFFIASNIFLYFQAFLLLVIQISFSFTNLTVINVSTIILAVFLIFLSIQFIISATGFSLLLTKWKENGVLLTLKKNLTLAHICGIIIAVALIFRSSTMIVDSIAYQYISTGQSQTIWNIFFKYLFWIIPEFIICVCLMLALYYTDTFTAVLARQEIAHKHGVTDFNVDNEHTDIKDLSSLKKLDSVESDETLLVLDDIENKLQEVNEPTSVKH